MEPLVFYKSLLRSLGRDSLTAAEIAAIVSAVQGGLGQAGDGGHLSGGEGPHIDPDL